MKIVLLEPLGVSPEKLNELAKKLEDRGHEFRAYDVFTSDTDELKERVAGADILILASHPLPGEVIESEPGLKFISVAFVGIDHVDLNVCKKRGIPVSNTGGYCDDAVAELALGLTLDCLRNISECDRAVKSGLGKGKLSGNELAGKTVGIVGTGAIGRRSAQLFKAFKCKLVGFNRSKCPEAEAIGIEMMSLEDLMKVSDIVSIHTPLTPDTKGLIGEDEIKLMKNGAILINTARGPVVDNKSLADALKANKIKAGIDVYENDPPLSKNHPLMGVGNIVMTPHVAFDTKESIERRAYMAFENVEAWLRGQAIRIMN